jgi:hypothetical protein
MQYFVSIENTNYFYWQIELLIESFKMCNLEDNLIIGIAENNEAKPTIFSKNIVGHPHKFLHVNYGEKNNYLPLNKPFSIIVALESGILKSPFAVIHPDMVIQKSLEEPDVNITFQGDPSVGTLVDKIKPQLQEMADENKFDINLLPANIPLGSTMIFKDVPKEFFYRVMARMNWYAIKNPEADWDLAKAAWLLTIYENLGKLKAKVMSLECRLIDNEFPANLIHYRYGLPPAFSKKYYTKFMRFDENPHEMLMTHNPTSATDFIQKVVQSYRGED